MRASMLSWVALMLLVNSLNAQAPRDGARQTHTASGWPNNNQPNINYEGLTRADRASAMAPLAEIEQIFYRIPELASPTEFVVRSSSGVGRGRS